MMKYEMSHINSETLTTIKELDKGVSLEHFGNNESVNIRESNETTDAIYGNPEVDSQNWHHQSEKLSCTLACQEFVAEQLTGCEFSESDIKGLAEENGWYTSENGTSTTDVGKLLETFGIKVERGENYSLNDLAEALESGEKVICSVNSKVMSNTAYTDIPGLRANHAVQVIGIDVSNPAKVEIILNDPGVENGKGLRVDAETFIKAWETGDNYAMIAKK